MVAFETVRGQLEKVFDVVSSSRISDLRAFGHAMLEEGVTLTPDRESDSLEWESRHWRQHFSYLTSAISCCSHGTEGLLQPAWNIHARAGPLFGREELCVWVEGLECQNVPEFCGSVEGRLRCYA